MVGHEPPVLVGQWDLDMAPPDGLRRHPATRNCNALSGKETDREHLSQARGEVHGNLKASDER